MPEQHIYYHHYCYENAGNKECQTAPIVMRFIPELSFINKYENNRYDKDCRYNDERSET